MYQFYHFDTFPVNKTKHKMAFKEVTKEFMRHPCAIPHVPTPLPPKIRYGIDAYEAERIIRERAAKAKDSKGRKLRSDAQACVSSVTSFPRELQQEQPDLYEEWVLENIKYFKNKYGDNFLSCIEHLDENHPNLHFIIAIDDTMEHGMANIKYIHEPIKRRDEQKGSKAKVIAFSEAAREMQDDYYNKVSIRFGLQRTGPGRKRLKRKEYMTAKREAELLAAALRANEQKEVVLHAKEQKLAAVEDRVIANAKDIIQRKENLKELENKVNQTSEEIIDFEYNYLQELDKSSPNKFKDFYNKRVSELKNKILNLEGIYKELRSKYNSLLTKFTNQKIKLDEVEQENQILTTENLKLKTALQIRKDSDNIKTKELEITYQLK